MRVNLELFTIGHCFHPECTIHRNFSFKKMKFPALVAKIRHPKYGYILFDTGYSDRIFESAKKFPWSLYLKILDPHINKNETLVKTLQNKNISQKDIAYIIISHFHPDHIGGLFDFPSSRLFFSKSALMLFKNKNPIKNLFNGIIPNLIPNDFISRTKFIDECKIIYLSKKWEPFQFGYDLFGDESVIAIELNGHSVGQIGIIVKTEEDKEVFLIADTCWTKEAYEKLVYPMGFVRFISEDYRIYINQINKINQLYQKREDLFIIPSHCQYSIEKYINS